MIILPAGPRLLGALPPTELREGGGLPTQGLTERRMQSLLRSKPCCRASLPSHPCWSLLTRARCETGIYGLQKCFVNSPRSRMCPDGLELRAPCSIPGHGEQHVRDSSFWPSVRAPLLCLASPDV